MTFQIKPAERAAVPALIGLWGFSNSGKTMGALLLARGLVGPDGKIVVIDTENGRALIHSSVAAPWHHLDFQPPFSPARYSAAMDAAEGYGADCIVIDSASHVWEGEGGVIDMADKSSNKGLGKWRNPKMEYKRMINKLLRNKVHVIFCMRAKDKYVQTGRGDSGAIEYIGPTQISDKNLIYEMTVALHLQDDHTFEVDKVPAGLQQVFPRRETGGKKVLISAEMGTKMADWIKQGKPVDQDFESLKGTAREKATEGTEAMRKWWGTLDKEQRISLAPIQEDLRSTAIEADQREKAPEKPQEAPQGGLLDESPEKEEPSPEPSSGDTGNTTVFEMVSAQIMAATNKFDLDIVWGTEESMIATLSDAQQSELSSLYDNRAAELSEG